MSAMAFAFPAAPAVTVVLVVIVRGRVRLDRPEYRCRQAILDLGQIGTGESGRRDRSSPEPGRTPAAAVGVAAPAGAAPAAAVGVVAAAAVGWLRWDTEPWRAKPPGSR